jgi:hypothetical protein
VIAAIEVLQGKFDTHDSLERYLLKLNRDLAARCAKGYLSAKFTALIKASDDEPDLPLEDGESLWDKVVEDAISLLPSPFERPAWFTSEEVEEQIKREAETPAGVFRRALQLDGFLVTDGVLMRELPVDVGLPSAESEIDRLLLKHGLNTPKGHLNQTLDAHARGNWAAANSQIRTFLDALLDEIAAKLDPTAANLGSGQPRRAKLASMGFLCRDLNEWDDNGLGFMNGLAKRLHPQGSHPGLSDDEDSTFRLHVVLLTARLLLTRFDTWGTL